MLRFSFSSWVLLLALTASAALARPVEETGILQKLQFAGAGSPVIRTAGVAVFGAAQPGTTWYGGTIWAADSARWEALEDSVWTFDTGVGSHFDHSAPWVNPFKDPSLHAYMEGWVGFDNSYSEITYFRRVTDSDPRWEADVCVGAVAGLGGNASYWCGVFPEEALSLCHAAGQGYGNSWALCIRKLLAYAGGGVTLDFDYTVETESGFDFGQVVVDTAGLGNPGDEILVIQYDGVLAGHESITLSPGLELPSAVGNVYIKFCVYSDGAWSDADGLNATTCGAFAIDNVQLSGGIVDGPATFEVDDDGWILAPAQPGPGGEWSNLVHLGDLPPTLSPCDCTLEDSVLVFNDLLVGGHNEFADNLAASPWIDLGPDGYNNQGPGKIFETNIYAELPLMNYVFVQFNVQWYPEVCAATGKFITSPWQSNGFVYYFGGIPFCPQSGEIPTRINFSAMVPGSAEQMRLGLGMLSYCRFFANCTGVSNSSPWFDNVKLGVYGLADAPIIQARAIDLPQDTFPQNGTLNWQAPGRIDSNNIIGDSSPEVGTALADTLIVQGASENAEVFVQFSMAPGIGVDSLDFAVYLTSVTYEETRDGQDWYVAQMDTAELGASGPVVGTWMTARIEGSPGFVGSDTDTDPYDTDVFGRHSRLLNDIFPDDLLTAGSHLSLFYKTRYLGGTTWFVLPDTTGGNYFAMEVLPSSMSPSQEFNCVLYVDHFDGLGAEPIIEDALRSILGTGGGTFEGDYFDTYNVRAPSSQQASLGRPQGFVTGMVSATQYGADWDQLIGYGSIIWNSGNLPSFNLTKEDGDALIPWLTLAEFQFRNLYFSGDGLVRSAIEEAASEPSARRVIEDLAGVQLTCDTYRNLDCPAGKLEDLTTCVNIDPVAGAKVADSLGRITGHLGQGNGCPELRSFDVLGTNPSPNFGVATPDEVYSTAVSTSAPDGYASVAIDAADNGSLTYRIVTDGLSIHYRRAAANCTFSGDTSPVTSRLTEVLTYHGYSQPEICEDPTRGSVPPPPPRVEKPTTSLLNFRPNPFMVGPHGVFRFSMERAGPAVIEVFDINGRKVATIFDGEAEEGVNESFWDGIDDHGRPVASGVYFYRLQALGTDFSKKLIVLRR